MACQARLLNSGPYVLGTELDCPKWCMLATSLGVTDFDVCSVNWNKPMEWREKQGEGWGAIMPQYAGYLIVILFGVFFSVISTIIIKFEETYGGLVLDSESFNTAGRSIKTGLTAAVIVAQWTWAATLLQSSNVASEFGLSGPFWYAAGATIQVLLFGILAIEIKKKSPNMHTFLEMIDVRWGPAAHKVFLCLAFATNLIVTGMLLLGGAAVMNASSDMPTVAALFLIPVGVILYTMFGGLKATFLASYIHTAIIMICMVIFITYVYVIPGGPECQEPSTDQCNAIGSAALMWERLTFLSHLEPRTQLEAPGNHRGPVVGNRGGSYLTMLSEGGLSFGIINIIGNFGTVFLDQAYWQSAIAARPSSAHRGYLLGGLVWFTIPMALATSLGLSSLALNINMPSSEAGQGLSPPAAAIILLGPGGGYMIIIMLFMAIVSTGSAECIAVASIVAYDIYRRYVKPDCTGQELLRVSRIVVVVYGVISGFFGWFLYGLGANLGWVYNFMGIIIGAGVFPVALCILSKYTTKNGAISGVFGGLACSITAWLVIASTRCEDGSNPEKLPNGATCRTGVLDINTTGNLNAQLGGNLCALLMSGIICQTVTLIEIKMGWAKEFDWTALRTGISRIENTKDDIPEEEMTVSFLTPASAWSIKMGVGLSILLIIVWPVTVLCWGVFDKALYTVWASVAFVWGYVACVIIVVLPVYESSDNFIKFFCCQLTRSAGKGKVVEVASA